MDPVGFGFQPNAPSEDRAHSQKKCELCLLPSFFGFQVVDYTTTRAQSVSRDDNWEDLFRQQAIGFSLQNTLS